MHRLSYDDLYPDTVELCFAEGDLVRFEETSPCVVCGETTHWLEVDFEASLCSRGCVKTLWKQYADACVVGHP